MLFHNIMDDWSIASISLKTSVPLEDFSWTQVRSSLSGSDPNWSSLTSNYSTRVWTSVLSKLNRLISSIIWVPSSNVSCVCAFILVNCPQFAFFTYIACISSSIHNLMHFCNVMLVGLSAFISSACSECCRMVRRWSAGTCSHHWRHADVSDNVCQQQWHQSILHHRHNPPPPRILILPRHGRLWSPKASEFDIPRTRRKFGESFLHRKSTRMECSDRCSQTTLLLKHLCSNVSSTWHILTHNFIWLSTS